MAARSALTFHHRLLAVIDCESVQLLNLGRICLALTIATHRKSVLRNLQRTERTHIEYALGYDVLGYDRLISVALAECNRGCNFLEPV